MLQKKIKKIATARKNSIATHIANICLCLQPHKANPKAKSKESNFPTLYQNHQTG
jgi:hypothetical protein